MKDRKMELSLLTAYQKHICFLENCKDKDEFDKLWRHNRHLKKIAHIIGRGDIYFNLSASAIITMNRVATFH